MALLGEEKKSDSALAIYAHAANWCADVLRPSIFSKGPRPRISTTAYLDGLRGFAAFLVYWGHHHGWARAGHASHRLENAFGYQDQYLFACLPGIRLFFVGGHISVSTFFVISGYVLSAKPLALIHDGELLRLGDNLASAMFRRWMRLFIPLIGTTFLYMCTWHVFGELPTAFPPHAENFHDEFYSWASEVKNFTYIYRSSIIKEEPWLTYNFHLWSIPVEFRGSIVIFTTLLSISRFTRNARLYTILACMFYFLYVIDGWFCAMFLSGMLICDLELLAKKDNLPKFFRKFEQHKTAIFYTLFIAGIYLGGVPSFSFDPQPLKESFGWYYLSFIKSTSLSDYKWFYLFWGSSFIVASIPHIHWLKAFFETRFCQYLGRISFALYLVHGPVLWTLGDRLYLAVGWTRENNIEGLQHWFNLFPLPKVGPFGLDPAFWLLHLILLPVTLWLAEIVTKVFDKPSIRFAQWLYAKGLTSL